MAKVLIFNVTQNAVAIASSGAIVKARSTAEADENDPVLTSAVKSGRVVVMSTVQPPKAEEPKVEAEAETPKPEEESSEAAQAPEEEVEESAEESAEDAAEESEAQEENKSKRPSRPKVVKEN